MYQSYNNTKTGAPKKVSSNMTTFIMQNYASKLWKVPDKINNNYFTIGSKSDVKQS
jgi:hypothetical protein